METSTTRTRRWAHRTFLEHSKGRVRALCECGWQGSGWMTEQEARELAAKHTGAKEKVDRRSVHDD